MVNSTLPYRIQQARGMSRFCFRKGVMIGCAGMFVHNKVLLKEGSRQR